LGIPSVLLAAHHSRDFQRLVRLYGHELPIWCTEADDDFLLGFE
jgi:hypothetical protein